MTAHRARSRARAWALQVLYAADLRDTRTPAQALEDWLSHRRIAAPSRPYLRHLVGLVAAHREALDARISGALTNWRLERLSAIDRNVLRIGAAELLHGGDDVPARVAIQEAVRLAERYGTAESARFVNGVLDAIHRGGRAGADDRRPEATA